MNTTSRQASRRTRYHRDAFQFVFAALRCAQRILDRLPVDETQEDEAHISGSELLEGVRQLAISEFGLLANTVFRHWGIRSTVDFGHIVFELISCATFLTFTISTKPSIAITGSKRATHFRISVLPGLKSPRKTGGRHPVLFTVLKHLLARVAPGSVRGFPTAR